MLIIDAMDFRGVDLNLLVCLQVLLVERHARGRPRGLA
jgi:hypothetical protein